MLPGYEHLVRTGAGPMKAGGPKLCLHTTEGKSIAGAVAALDKHKSWSHFLLSFEENRKIQFLEVSQAGKSLRNDADGYETNKANVVQIEICGFAGEAKNWPLAKLDWLADRFKEIRSAFNFPLTCLDFKVPATRLSDRAAVDYTGILGHQHFPDNSHWDPGALNVPYIIERMKGGSMAGMTKEEFIVNHELIYGTTPGAGAMGWVGISLSEFLTMAAKDPAALANQLEAGTIIAKKDCPVIPPVVSPQTCKCDIEEIAEAVFQRHKKQIEKE